MHAKPAKLMVRLFIPTTQATEVRSTGARVLGKSLMREKVERLYISLPVLATPVARKRCNLGSCGSVSVANSTEEKEGTLQSGCLNSP